MPLHAHGQVKEQRLTPKTDAPHGKHISRKCHVTTHGGRTRGLLTFGYYVEFEKRDYAVRR